MLQARGLEFESIVDKSRATPPTEPRPSTAELPPMALGMLLGLVSTLSVLLLVSSSSEFVVQMRLLLNAGAVLLFELRNSWSGGCAGFRRHGRQERACFSSCWCCVSR
jgi:hypothetical protein